MGLAGMLIVRPDHARARRTTSAATAYDVEAPVVLGAVDPAFNAAPDTFDLHRYTATYWLINGKAYPDTARITAAAGQRVLLRYANAGFDNTSMLAARHARAGRRAVAPARWPTRCRRRPRSSRPARPRTPSR